MDLRQFSRYKIVGPATFTWIDGDGQGQGDGWTRDVNQRGAYIYSANCPPTGARTKLQIVLPTVGKAGRLVKVEIDARVLRVDTSVAEQEAAGFAVLCMHLSLRTTGEDGSEETIEDSALDTPES